MKLPVPAPLLHEILDQHPDRIMELVQRGIGPEIKGVYEHWDKLRHRTPPDGLSSEL